MSKLKTAITNHIVAIVGMPGSGKSEATKYISSRFGYKKVYFGGVVLNEVTRQGLPITPENERITRESLRAKLGMAAISIVASAEIDTYIAEGSNVIVDGLYSLEEWQQLLTTYDGRLVLIACHSDLEIRQIRLSTRNHRSLSQAEANRRDMEELTKLNKAIPIVLADYHIVNNGSIEVLHNSIDRILDKLYNRYATH